MAFSFVVFTMFIISSLSLSLSLSSLFLICFFLLICRVEENRKELQVEMAKLSKTRCKARKPYSTRTTLDS
jgi:hypothetical protein